IAGTFELRREPEDQAKNTEFSSDLFVLGMAKIDKGIGETSKLTGLVLELAGEHGAALPTGPRQSVTAQGKDVYLLKLGKKHRTHVKATEQDIKEGLKETNAYPTSDPKIQELARKAVGDAKTDGEKVKRLCQFVHDFIKPSLAATMPKMHD